MEINLIEAASQLINKCNDNNNHTVAAAILNEDGSITTGVNLYYFTGGPCAELVALANVAAGKHRPIMVVAVGNNRRVLPPCGRCRQVLFEYYPEIKVIVSNKDVPVVKSISELLPDTYDWNAEQ